MCDSGRACARMRGFALTQFAIWARLRHNARSRAPDASLGAPAPARIRAPFAILGGSAPESVEPRFICASRRACASMRGD
eukprot:9491586-Pyramimonas_sp.AAC.1